MHKRLTPLTVTKTAKPPKGRLEIWDELLPGFGLRITDKDRRSFFVMCMAGTGKPVRDAEGNIIAGRRLRRITLNGDARVIPLDQAREQARDILRRAAAGEDPTRRQAAVPTFRDFVAGYLERRRGSLRPSTYADLSRMLHVVARQWGDRPINEIRSQDVIALTDDTVARGAAIHANRLLSALRTLFGDALRRGAIDTSPVALLKPPSKERSRERALSDDEIATFWTATRRLGWPFGHAYRLLALTAQRRGQVRSMTWSEIGWDRKTWSIAGSKMKAGREHQVALSGLALEILTEARDIATSLGTYDDHGLVFSFDGRRPLAGFPKAKGRLDKEMRQVAGKAIAGWRIHDLRRTCVHGLAQLGFAPHIADRILAHTQGTIHGVAAVYNQYEYLDERRDALAAWGRKIEEIIGRGRGNVVPLKR
jgi:integrase